MTTFSRFLLFAALIVGPTDWGRHGQGREADTDCRLLQQALSDYAQIRPGSSRGELEKYFSRDGGFQTPDSTRYVYSKCEYLHVDLEFELAGSDKMRLSAGDKVTKISKLYVEYPAKD